MRAGMSLLTGMFMLFGVTVSAVAGAPAGQGGPLVVESPGSAQVLLPGQDKPPETKEALPNGTYVLPESPAPDNKGQRCITVCAQWGEECILITQGHDGRATGGMRKRCRHTCKQLAEECF